LTARQALPSNNWMLHKRLPGVIVSVMGGRLMVVMTAD
jgi:hypothetical protein